MSIPLPAHTVAKLVNGSIEDRDRAARELAALLAGNIATLLEELGDVLAMTGPIHTLAPMFLNQIWDAELKLANAVDQCARGAGLIPAE